MVKTAVVVPKEQDFILSSLSPGRAQRRFALAVVLALLVAFFIMAWPLSSIQLGRIDAFVRSPRSCCLPSSLSCVRVRFS